MRQGSIPALLALTSIALAISGCDRQESPRDEAAAAASPVPALGAQEPSAQPPERIEVSVELDQAHESFVKRDFDKVAESLRSAGTKLKTAAENAPADTRQVMRTSADALDRAAVDVRAGTIASVDAMDRKLAEANAALARVHHMQAMDAWTASDARAAGRELKSAADHVDAGTKRLGHDMKKGTAEAVRDAQRVGDALVRRADVSAIDVERTMKELGREIERLVKDVVARPRQAPS